jgi:transcription initiation factor TFIIIB Brf1 subunit/transcription initiation factor TFIIB
MQFAALERCQDCSLPLLDVGDELVCPACGLVKEKSIVEAKQSSYGKLPLFGRLPLGSYMGTKGITAEERRSRVSGDHTSYEKMKAISDFTAKEGSSAESGKLIERVGEKLFLPRVVMLQAATISKKVFGSPHPNRRLTVAEVSAFSLVCACKIEGVTSVSIREILDAFADLGKKVRSSSIFKLSLESPVRAFARRPEDYIPRVIAKLSMNRRLAARLGEDGVRASEYLARLRALAGEIVSGCEPTSLAGKRPCALAASAVYSAEAMIASEEGRRPRITQRESAECGDTAEYTVREHCSKLFTPVIRKMSLSVRTLPVQAERRIDPRGRLHQAGQG